jgi:hypothetical protein
MEIVQLTKEDLQKAKIEIDDNIEKINLSILDIKKRTRIHIPFLVASFVIAFFYPIIFTNFNVLSYSILWLLAMLMLLMRIEMFLKLIKTELDHGGFKMVQTAIENDLELIRKKEYDELTRKIYNKKDSSGSQNTDEPAARS